MEHGQTYHYSIYRSQSEVEFFSFKLLSSLPLRSEQKNVGQNENGKQKSFCRAS